MTTYRDFERPIHRLGEKCMTTAADAIKNSSTEALIRAQHMRDLVSSMVALTADLIKLFPEPELAALNMLTRVRATRDQCYSAVDDAESWLLALPPLTVAAETELANDATAFVRTFILGRRPRTRID